VIRPREDGRWPAFHRASDPKLGEEFTRTGHRVVEMAGDVETVASLAGPRDLTIRLGVAAGR